MASIRNFPLFIGYKDYILSYEASLAAKICVVSDIKITP